MIDLEAKLRFLLSKLLEGTLRFLLSKLSLTMNDALDFQFTNDENRRSLFKMDPSKAQRLMECFSFFLHIVGANVMTVCLKFLHDYENIRILTKTPHHFCS